MNNKIRVWHIAAPNTGHNDHHIQTRNDGQDMPARAARFKDGKGGVGVNPPEITLVHRQAGPDLFGGGFLDPFP